MTLEKFTKWNDAMLEQHPTWFNLAFHTTVSIGSYLAVRNWFSASDAKAEGDSKRSRFLKAGSIATMGATLGFAAFFQSVYNRSDFESLKSFWAKS